MSNYSHALQTVIDGNFEGKQSSLADKADVPQSLISRHLTGNFRPDPETLEKICASLKPGPRARLAAAHLNDETAPSARYYVKITTSEEDTTTAPITMQDTEVFERLDRDTRRALEIIGAAAIDSRAAREALRNTAKFIEDSAMLDKYPASGKPGT